MHETHWVHSFRECAVSESNSEFLGLEFRAHLWDTCFTVAPARPCCIDSNFMKARSHSMQDISVHVCFRAHTINS